MYRLQQTHNTAAISTDTQRGHRFRPPCGALRMLRTLSYVSLGSDSQEVQPLSPCSATAEAWGPWGPRSITREAAATRRPGTTTRECAPLTTSRAKPVQQQGPSKGPRTPHPRKEPGKEELKPTQCSAYPSSGLSSGRCRPAFRGNCRAGGELACPPVD